VITIPEPVQLSSQINNAIHEIEKRLKNAGMEVTTAANLVEPLRSVGSAIEQEGDWSVSVALFRSPELFRYFLLRGLTTEFVKLGERFQIRPLLRLVSHDQKFYLLALSQKQVRLFRCTNQSEQELQLRKLAPESLQVWLNNRIPDHVLDNRAFGGPSVGSMKGVVFGTNTDRERVDEYLAHFFKEVDKGVNQMLARETAPLVLAGVETETALYREINSYQHLAEQAVHGSPQKVSPTELHDRALAIMRQSFSAPLRRVMSKFQDYQDAKRVSMKVDEILERAHEGRVSDLLLREDAKVCNEANGQEDPLNLAALQTISHRGQAFALKAQEMPGRADAVAVLRF
jgi:hypothetical protein